MFINRVVKKHKFTLVEIMVSMGVFLILLTMLLNFFSGTRQVWKSLRERNEAFENARVAMDLMSELFSTSVAGKNIGFWAGDGSGISTECTFFTCTTRSLSDAVENSNVDKELGNFYAVRIYVKDGALCISSQKMKNIAGESSAKPTLTENEKVIIKNVKSLEFTNMISSPAGKRTPALGVKLVLFDNKENYNTYKNLPADKKDAFSDAHTYTFARTISFDDVEDPIYEVKNETP